MRWPLLLLVAGLALGCGQNRGGDSASPRAVRDSTVRSGTQQSGPLGLSRQNPIQLGSTDQFGGPAAQRLYLSHLRDGQGRPLRFERLGSSGAAPDGHILDLYRLTADDGSTFHVYLDMYHPDRPPLEQPPPEGLHMYRGQ